jgi:hypothetical protein
MNWLDTLLELAPAADAAAETSAIGRNPVPSQHLEPEPFSFAMTIHSNLQLTPTRSTLAVAHRGTPLTIGFARQWQRCWRRRQRRPGCSGETLLLTDTWSRRLWTFSTTR